MMILIFFTTFLQKVFLEYDKDKDGTLSPYEMRDTLAAVGGLYNLLMIYSRYLEIF